MSSIYQESSNFSKCEAKCLPQLPDEMHRHIISFIAQDEMDNVKLTCKDFYAHCCAVQNRKNYRRLRINIEMLNDETIVDSMTQTLRRFSSIMLLIDDFLPHHLESLYGILENIGSSVTDFSINAISKNVKFPQSSLINWLNRMPNLTSVGSAGLYKCEDVLDYPNEKLELAALESIQLCPFGLGLKLHQMPNSSIKFIQFNDKTPLPNINEIFEKHSQTLRELHLFRPVYNDPVPFRHLQLSEFTCLYQSFMENVVHDEFLLDIIENQQGLKILNLGERDLCSNCYPISSNLLRKICTKTDLINLSFGVSSSIEPHQLLQVQNLKRLEELTIQTHFDEYSIETDEIMETLCNLKLPQLNSFNMLSDFSSIPIDAILNSFGNLRSLDLEDSSFLFSPGYIYANMETLSLSSSDLPINIHPRLIQSMPNLNEFRIYNMYPSVRTFKALCKSKVKIIDILVWTEEDVSERNMRKIKNFCEKLELKCEMCEIVIGDDDESWLN